MNTIKRLKPMTLPLQSPAANTIYVDSDDNTIKVGTGASGSTERQLVDTLGGWTGQILSPDGTAAAPSYSWSSEPTSGWYRSSSGVARYSRLNADQFQIGNGSVQANAYGFGSAIGTFDAFLIPSGTAGFIQQRNGTNPMRFDVTNTYASTTSYEAFSIDWQTLANTAIVGTRTAATGTGRVLGLVAQADNAANTYGAVLLQGQANPRVRIGAFSSGAGASLTSGATGNWMTLGEGISSATSGSIVRVAVIPEYNQASGNAANTDLLINRTETSVGSGVQNFIECQVAGAQKVAISNGGTINTTGNITVQNATAIPAGGVAGAGYRFSSTSNFGMFFGSGAPSLSAAKGSLYLRSDGSSTTTRAYINTDGGTTWTAISTVA